MLDQISNGRLQFGLGRGISPIEATYYGLDPANAQAQFNEALEVIQIGLKEERLSYSGKFYQFDDVPMMMSTVQQPSPPLWYGLHSPESAERAALLGYNMVSLDGIELARPTAARYKEVSDGAQVRRDPMVGLCRFIVVADDDAKAAAIAELSYDSWNESFNYLFRLKTVQPAHGKRPGYDEATADGRLVFGSPETVAGILGQQLDDSAFNYLLGQFVFGNMTMADAKHSVKLFAEKVMPVLDRVSQYA